MTYKIGFLLGSLKGAGSEKTVLTLANALAKHGHHIDLYLLDTVADYPLPDDIHAIHVPGINKRQKRAALAQLTAQQNYNLFITSRADFYASVHAANVYCSVHITPTAWLKKNPKKFWKRPSQLFKLRRKFANKPLIALSQGIRDDLVHNLKCNPANVQVINNPFDVEHIRRLANEPGQLPNTPYIVCIASFIPRKRHKDLLKAFSLIEDDNLQLVLVGQGGLQADLMLEAKKLKIADRVIFWGWDINPYRLIKNARVSVLASEAEGMPRVVVESLLLGTPVVTTDCRSGPRELMTNDLAPFLAPVGDPAILAEEITQALKGYPVIDQHPLERFSADQVAGNYEYLIQHPQDDLLSATAH